MSTSFSQCRVRANTGARRFFGRPLGELPGKKQTFHSRAFVRGTDTGNASECKLR
jgi:hypothetical protein